MTGIKVLTPSILLLLACLAPGTVQAQTDWERDGLIGPVRRVRSEVALTLQSEGKMAEAPRALLSMEVYDQQGRKRGQTIYPARALENQQLEQSYHFNERGDISEATLKEAGGGRVVEERKYQYEYDPVGNWTKRIVAVSKTGEANQSAPVEVIHRLVIYYLTRELARAIGYEPLDVGRGGGAFFFEPNSKYPPRVFEPMFQRARQIKQRRSRYCFYRHGTHYHRRLCASVRRRVRNAPARTVVMEHEEHHSHAVLVASLNTLSGLPAPSVTAQLVDPARNARWRRALVQIAVNDLQIVDPIEADEVPHDGQGHVHLQLDDGPILAVPSMRMRLSRIGRGSHTIKVMLHANDHSSLGATQAQLQLQIP